MVPGKVLGRKSSIVSCFSDAPVVKKTQFEINYESKYMESHNGNMLKEVNYSRNG